MADVYIGNVPATTANATSLLLTEDAAGTATNSVTQQAVANLMNSASNLTAGTLPDARLSANVVLTGDSRLTNSRTPTAHKSTHATGQSDALAPSDIGAATSTHVHGNITNDGKVGSVSGLPLVTGSGGAITVGAWGAASGTFCQGNDPRLSDSRTPTSHASSHQTGGSDQIQSSVVTTNLAADTNSLSVAAYDIVRLTSSSSVNVNGLSASGCGDGKMVLLVNENASGGAAITIKHMSSSASAGNKVRSQFGNDIVLQADGGQVMLHLLSGSYWRG